MSNLQIDANDAVQNLLQQIAQLSQEKAMLQVQLAHLLKNLPEEGEEVNDDTA